MRHTLACAILALGLVALGGTMARAGDRDNKPATQPTTQSAQKAKYVCPMGCVTADKPGKCPRCGMALVPVDAD